MRVDRAWRRRVECSRGRWCSYCVDGCFWCGWETSFGSVRLLDGLVPLAEALVITGLLVVWVMLHMMVSLKIHFESTCDIHRFCFAA